ncbi:Autotransporter beta-domain-containing protein [Cohaesibacter sp. ES.047]|uniref:autotransporter outer membrane beta-barrel domain-containing protein n=1 Tax=Cohaesibacter sp. ES.047 TaxID=1798205 RepID=UPI000BB84094|nr:autotransporter outer membrane beta-barrel domain-containing protein [Cohaesibacter sp. ES.047]SNY93032.1 Autotransporter beta-domain-containing protein [Cohaesibacter sp. ES.047]
MKTLLKLTLAFSLCLVVQIASPDFANANSVSSCSTDPTHPNYDKKCYDECNLTDYFQFLYATASRPHECRNIPTSFWQYQTQVGEVVANGKSSSASAASTSSAASKVNGSGSLTLTPSSAITSGAMVLSYAPDLSDDDGTSILATDFSDRADDGRPSLEKAIWVKLLGTIGRKNATPDVASVKVESMGIMAGTDLYSNEFFRFGVLGSIQDVAVDINENNNQIDITAATGGVSATLELGKWYLDGLGTYGTERTKTSRSIDIDGSGTFRSMRSHYTNRRISAAFETGFRLTAGRFVVQPLAGVDVNWLMQDQVIEEGNRDLAILTYKNTTRTGKTRLGANLSTVILGDQITIVPTIGGFWSHRFGELSNANRISTDLGSSYEFVGSKPPLDVANVYASVLANLTPSVALSASYYASFNSIERNHTGNLALRVRW